MKRFIQQKYLHLQRLPHSKGQRCVAFTLAEVLITLGIIGVVAAITMPTLIQNHRKTVIETRLQKFYSTMNQAIKMAEVDYGSVTSWEPYETVYEKDGNGNDDITKPIANTEYFNKYFAPYIKILKVDTNANGQVVVYYPDGSLALFSAGAISFFPYAKDYSISLEEPQFYKKYTGIKNFTFMFAPNTNQFCPRHYGKGVEPYKCSWDGTIDQLKSRDSIGCKQNVTNERAYCTALIQINGWKIPKDYPIKF